MASDAKKILLVEDEKAIRDAVAAYLEREGYWVVGVGDGQSAIEEFEKHQFDLVVLDLMPVSYTHLDVYKRQHNTCPARAIRAV